jgi:pSer/pThr/pTyr-binding forkhead associated (FHA) protein
MPLLLVCLDGQADIALDRATFVVGRHRWCDVRIGSPRVSRRHCCLILGRDDVLVRDLGSTNGTLINGQRVAVGVLHLGDELSIANCRYQLQHLSRS